MAAPLTAGTGAAGAGVGATVLEFTRRFRRPEQPAAPTADAPPGPGDDRVVRERLAATLQALYGQHGLSLTDPATAAANGAAFAGALLILNGVHAHGLLGDEAHEMLTGMYRAAQDAGQQL